MADADDGAEAQRQAEAEVERFEHQLGPFVVAAEATRMPMVFMNAREPDHPIVFVNDSFLYLTGYARDEVLSRSLAALMAQGGEPGALAGAEAAFRGENGGQAEVEYRRKDGSTLWAGLFDGETDPVIQRDCVRWDARPGLNAMCISPCRRRAAGMTRYRNRNSYS